MLRKILSNIFKKKHTSNTNVIDPAFARYHENIINTAISDISEKWDELLIHFEYFPYKDTYREVHQSKYYFKGKKHEYTINIDVNDAFIDLNKAMSNPDKDAWSSCDLSVNNKGFYNFEFGYGIPPLLKEMLKGAGELDENA